MRRDAALPLPSAGSGDDAAARVWADALLAADLLANDPHGLGGAVVRAAPGPVRDAWLAALRAALPADTPWRRMPPGIGDDGLLGGLDLAATLAAGRPVTRPGLLAEAEGGVLVAPMAERLPPGTAGRLAAALDTGRAGDTPARFGLVLLDEGLDDETVPEALADRLAFRIDLGGIGPGVIGAPGAQRASPGAEPWQSHIVPRTVTAGLSSPLWGGVGGGGGAGGTATLDPEPHPPLTPPHTGEGKGGVFQRPIPDPTCEAHRAVEAGEAADPLATLCAVAEAFGVASLRGPVLAARVARALAAGAPVGEADAVAAARLVLAPRATRLPAADAEPEASPPEDQRAEDRPPQDDPPEQDAEAGAAEEVVLEAVRAAIPQNLLAALIAGAPRLAGSAGRSGAPAQGARTGRPVGSRRGDPRRGRLDLLATLRAAAPWQALRRGPETGRIVVRRDDLRIKTLRQRTETTTVFCVDASGSSALERLAEAKGAVELLLAESYVRRDRVALVAFRGAGAELVLPPTRSLTRAKRNLAGLPGGGGTPLAAGIDAALTVALGVRRGGGRPVVVVLTDGRANVARSGEGGRARAGAEALAAARALRAAGLPALVIDTGARGEGARGVAEAMGARYLPLPRADAGGLSAAMRAAR
ncbi:VWA domain-containing protein [Methylobacterium sp. NEAU 140]|uniref:VWA domain-containing protein n=1 Tax=Methylobacterium sp. NEAU 140 TaxID=3064945 RepID=UPI002735837D|nr:VWA domain-containing protein [Methylobacterium sp. NEAU 140]MDP4024883.1 VWA domain-containing protein [Methylobacterium sp. NEAU 140]